MAIHTEEIKEVRGGFEKELEASAIPMILDNLQITQYQFPVKSTIRELVSNGVDSIKERDAALQIISGKAKEEDYYIRRDDPLYKDSNFDAAYYDPAWLSSLPEVTIIYDETDNDKTDFFRVIDNGVGLGGARLAGYMKLGWSSKRNSKLPLGKFGIGAKAGLSTGIKYYTMISRYNGKEFRFNIYSQHIESIVPSMNMQTGKQNPTETFMSGGKERTIHYIPTNEKNGVEVVMETKKYRKQEFIDAVKTQLLYFKNVKLLLRKSSGIVEEIKIQPTILFEDDFLILSDNKQYSKPHMVINGVNYGYVNFQELELEEKVGNLGIKVVQEEVSVNPSRESLVWNEETRATVLKRFKQAADVATRVVEESLKIKDFIKWIKTYAIARYSYGNTDSVIGRLSSLVDFTTIKPSYVDDPSLKMSHASSLFPGIKFQSIYADTNKKGDKVIKRDDVGMMWGVNGTKQIYVTNKGANSKTLEYLATYHQEGFYLIQYLDTYDFDFDEIRKTEDHPFNSSTKPIREQMEEKRRKVIKLIEASKETKDLEFVIVPEDFEFETAKAIGTLDLADEAVKKISPEEYRRLNQRVVAYTPRGMGKIPYSSQSAPVNLYGGQKVQPTINKIENMKGDRYYGFFEDENLLNFAAAVSRLANSVNAHVSKLNQDEKSFTDEMDIFDQQITFSHHFMNNWGKSARTYLLRIAKDQQKHYSKWRHVKEFFARDENGTLTSSSTMINWYTAYLIAKDIDDAYFMENYKLFDPVLTQKYHDLVKYANKWYRPLDEFRGKNLPGFENKDIDEFISLNERKLQFQLMKLDDPTGDTDVVSQQLFGHPFKNAIAVDMHYYTMLQEVLEYARPLAPLLNSVEFLTNKDAVISPEQEAALHSFLSLRGIK